MALNSEDSTPNPSPTHSNPKTPTQSSSPKATTPSPKPPSNPSGTPSSNQHHEQPTSTATATTAATTPQDSSHQPSAQNVAKNSTPSKHAEPPPKAGSNNEPLIKSLPSPKSQPIQMRKPSNISITPAMIFECLNNKIQITRRINPNRQLISPKPTIHIRTKPHR